MNQTNSNYKILNQVPNPENIVYLDDYKGKIDTSKSAFSGNIISPNEPSLPSGFRFIYSPETKEFSINFSQSILDSLKTLPVTNNNDIEYDRIEISETFISEVLTMERQKMILVFRKQTNFFLVSMITLFLSFVGFFVYYRTGMYFLHPFLYVIVSLMGIGWGSTAIASIYTTKADKYGQK